MSHPRTSASKVGAVLLAGALTAMAAVAAQAATNAPPAPRIQVALLLDTSNSMDGLIDQARQQLWQTVDELSKARRDGRKPTLEVSVFEYGNSGLSARDGYVRKVVGLTRELDGVSEALFSLQTNGGDEFCGLVIQRAVDSLQWSTEQDDMRAIFIAGNEPFSQGPVAYPQAIAHARERGIVVHTIHAGPYDEGVREGWQQGARLAGGHYMSIDTDQKLAHVAAPQDARIAALNQALNETYVPYGQRGATGAARQREQDDLSSGIAAGLLSKRAKSKASALYSNSSWDLVDAVKDGGQRVEEMEPEALPSVMQPMSPKERKDYVDQKAVERDALQKQILELTKQRDAFVANERAKQAAAPAPTLEDALSASIHAQGEAKRFEFVAE